MEVFIKKAIAFLVFTTLFYSTALYFGNKYLPSEFKPNIKYRIGTYGHMFSRMKEVRTTKNVDILFLGSSHTYRGFDIRMFKKNEINAFNLGSSSQTPIQTLVLLKRYLEDLNPKLIIYEVYPGSLSSDGVESAVDIIANDVNDIHSLKMAWNINHAKVYNTLLYGMIQDSFKLNSSFTEPQVKREDTYIKGGFVEKEISYYEPKKLSKKEVMLNYKQMAFFEDIINMLQEKEIPLILVYAPIAPSNYKRYTNNNEFNSIMKSHATYYNFNEILQLEDSVHFYDSHHLNQLGVEIFNNKLLETIPKFEQENNISF